VPSLALRQGDFSALSTRIYDPATTAGRDRQLFPGNRIPVSRFDPVSQAALAYWPNLTAPARPTSAPTTTRSLAATFWWRRWTINSHKPPPHRPLLSQQRRHREQGLVWNS
jgi:hypothetical protein